MDHFKEPKGLLIILIFKNQPQFCYVDTSQIVLWNWCLSFYRIKNFTLIDWLSIANKQEHLFLYVHQ